MYKVKINRINKEDMFFDCLSSRYFKSNLYKVFKAIEKNNNDWRYDINDFYKELGLPTIPWLHGKQFYKVKKIKQDGIYIFIVDYSEESF